MRLGIKISRFWPVSGYWRVLVFSVCFWAGGVACKGPGAKEVGGVGPDSSQLPVADAVPAATGKALAAVTAAKKKAICCESNLPSRWASASVAGPAYQTLKISGGAPPEGGMRSGPTADE